MGSSLSRPPAMRRRSPWLASSHPAGTCAVHVLVPSALMRLTNSGESASAFHSFLPTVVVRLQRASPPRKSEPYSARNTAAKTAKTMRLTPLNLPCDAPAGRAGGGEGGARMSRDVSPGGRCARGTFSEARGVAGRGRRAGAHRRRGRLPSSAAAAIVRRRPSRSKGRRLLRSPSLRACLGRAASGLVVESSRRFRGVTFLLVARHR